MSESGKLVIVSTVIVNLCPPCQFLAPWFVWTRTLLRLQKGWDACWNRALVHWLYSVQCSPDTMCIVPQWVSVWELGWSGVKGLCCSPQRGNYHVGPPFLAHGEALWGDLSLAGTWSLCSLSFKWEILTPLHLGFFGFSISIWKHFVFLCSFEFYHHHRSPHHPPPPLQKSKNTRSKWKDWSWHRSHQDLSTKEIYLPQREKGEWRRKGEKEGIFASEGQSTTSG